MGTSQAHEVAIKHTPTPIDEDETLINGEYKGTVYIGTPPQAVSGIIFDTGSILPWVLNEAFCTNPKSPGCSVEAQYDSAKSSTFSYNASKSVWSTYGMGSAHAYVGTDKFCFNEGAENCMAKPFSFGAAYDSNDQPNQGIFGLAPEAWHKGYNCQSFLSQANSTIKDGTFSVFYSKDPKADSKIIFGPAEAEKYGKAGSTNADLQWADLIMMPTFSFQEWDIGLASAQVNGKTITPTIVGGITAIIDTGTTFLVVDGTSYDNLLKIAKVQGISVETKGYNSVLHGCKKSDCSDFPSIDVTFKRSNVSTETFTLSLESSYFISQGANGTNKLGLFSTKGLPTNGTQWIVGLKFLNKFYTVFDYDNKRIGFVEQRKESATLLQSTTQTPLFAGIVAIILIGVIVQVYLNKREIRQKSIHDKVVELRDQRESLNVNSEI